MIETLLNVVAIIGLFRMAIYALGDTHKQYNPQAILSYITYSIALVRLKEVGHAIEEVEWKDQTLEGKANRRAVMSYTVEQARMAGGWVNVLGFCPICTSFWVMALVVLPLYGWAWFGVSLLLTKTVVKWM